MQTAYKNVEGLFDELEPFLKRAGIKASMPTGDIDQIKTHVYADVFDWLESVLTSPELAEVKKAWALATPEQWEHYDMLGITGMPEQKILKSKLDELRKLWNTGRPGPFFGRHYESHKDSTVKDSS